MPNNTELTQFDYLLNAFEQASQSDNPAANDYGKKRGALLAHVRALEAAAAPQAAQAGEPSEDQRAAVKFYQENPSAALFDFERRVRQPASPQVERPALTDAQIDALIPEPDGTAEANVERVEVLPGVMGTEFDEVDAWSRPLVRRAVRAALAGTTTPEGS